MDKDRVREKGLLRKAFGLFVYIVVSVIFSIFLEFIIMTIYYPNQGANHSLDMFNAEIKHLQHEGLNNSDYGNGIVSKIVSYQIATKEMLIEESGLKRVTYALSDSRWIQQTFSKNGLLHPKEYALSILNMVNVMSMRIVIIILSLPIFTLLFLWGLGIGLTNRGIRRYQVRHETAWVFHHAKRIKFWSIVIPITFYFVWPESVSPFLVFAPFAACYGASWLVMASKFKKDF